MRIRFFVVDGHSTDGSADIVAQRTRHDARFVLLATPRPDKTAQINAALRRATAPWVLVTDADARLPREALVEVRRAALADPSVTVIGAPVVPIGAHPVEQLHYRVGNWLRSREARRGSASMVLGPCYAFRRALLDQLPSNVLADDVYVAWFAASVGGRVGLAEALAAELRTPRAIGELFRHKTRRGLGVLRELLRFLPRVTRMPPAMRAMLLCRAALFLLVPPLLAGALSDIRIAAAAAPLGILPLLLVATLQRPSAIVSASALIVVLVGAAAVSLAAYPFSRVTACHSRLREQVDEST
jgi:cellulose synthase/poly-beta-1,6-N-acetylglucosamine synthase-like glycosyltransferase